MDVLHFSGSNVSQSLLAKIAPGMWFGFQNTSGIGSSESMSTKHTLAQWNVSKPVVILDAMSTLALQLTSRWCLSLCQVSEDFNEWVPKSRFDMRPQTHERDVYKAQDTNHILFTIQIRWKLCSAAIRLYDRYKFLHLPQQMCCNGLSQTICSDHHDALSNIAASLVKMD